jgi:hypothetical protein
MRWSRLLYLVLAGLALGNAGCLVMAAAAGAGAAGATGYAYYRGKVSQTYAANLDQVWTATHAALGELGMPVVSADRSTRTASIESRTVTDRVQITLEMQPSPIPADGPLTRVGVRVATFGDEVISQRLHERIAAHLGTVRPTLAPIPVPVPNGGGPAAPPMGSSPEPPRG